MGNSEEHPGSVALEARRVDSNAIRRLAVSTCVLMVTTVCTLLITNSLKKEEDERLIRATQLAEEGLGKVLQAGGVAGARDVPSGEEWIVSGDSGERFVRTVKITPGDAIGQPERVTVTIGWETIAGRNRVSMHALLVGTENDCAAGVDAGSTREVREALLP